MAVEEVGLKLSLKDRASVAAGLKSVEADVKDVGEAADKAGRKAGASAGGWGRMRGAVGRVAKGVLVAGGVIASGALVAGRALYQMGGVFDDVEDTIRVGTGATGKHLDSLVKSAKSIGREVPAAFADIGPVVADINTRLGLTGKPLEKLSKQFLEAGRITGTAIDAKKMTSAFSAFGIEGARTTKAMDQIYRISQATGVGMNELAASTAKNAPAMRQFGFGLSDTASLLGTLDKAGLSGDKTLATLSRAMVGFAKEGRAPRKALQDTVSEIDRLAKAGDQSGAVNLAAKVFGTRGAGQFVAAIESGKVSLDQLTKGAGVTGDKILKAGKDTEDFAEKWQRFKNRGLVLIEPVATRVFGLLGDGMDLINTKVVPAISAFVGQMRSGEGAGGKFADALERTWDITKTVFGFITDNIAPIGAFVGVLLGVAGAVKIWSIAQAILNAALWSSPITWIALGIGLLVAGLVLAYQKSETFRGIVNALWNNVLKPFGSFLGGVLLTTLGNVAAGLLRMGAFGIRAFRWLLKAAFKAFDGILLAAEKGLGWVPGLGDKIRTARASFDDFGNRTINKLQGVENKLKAAADKADNLGKPRPPVYVDIITREFSVKATKNAGAGRRTNTGTGDDRMMSGGTVLSGRPYVVGEVRPELFVPQVPGVILPRVPSPIDLAAGHGAPPQIPAISRQPIQIQLQVEGHTLAEVMLNELVGAGARE